MSVYGLCVVQLMAVKESEDVMDGTVDGAIVVCYPTVRRSLRIRSAGEGVSEVE